MEETKPGASTAPETEGPPREPTPRVLRRSTDDRVLFGVAGGLGRYFDIDPVIVRIAFVLLAVFGGSGVLLYVIGLVAIPEQRPADPVGATGSSRGRAGQDVGVALGAVLIVIGSLTLAGRFLPAVGDLLGPALLVTTGVLVIVLGGRR